MSRIGIDKGDYILVVDDSEKLLSFAIEWTQEKMKERGFQKWLDLERMRFMKDVPPGYVLVDSNMDTIEIGENVKNVRKVWRYADPSTLSVKAK